MRLVERWNKAIWFALDQMRGVLSSIEAVDILIEVLVAKLLVAHIKEGKKTTLEPLALESEVLSQAIANKNLSKQIIEVMTYLEQKPLLQGVFTSLSKQQSIHEIASKLEEINFEGSLQEEEAIREFFLTLMEKREQVGKGDGFTPISIRKLVSGLLSGEPLGEIYDPVIGSGSLALEVALENQVGSIYGQDISSQALRCCKLLLIACGKADSIKHIQSGDTLLEPAHLEDDELKQWETIVAVPPMGITVWDKESLQANAYGRFGEEVCNLRIGDMLFINHIVKSLKDQGRAVVLVNNGVLFRQGAEAMMRKQLLEQKIIECIIQLPGKMLTNTAIPTSLIIFNKKQVNESILFMDLTNEVSKISKLTTVLSDETIDKACEIYHKQLETSISKKVAISEVMKNDCNLTVNRYFELRGEAIDLEEVNRKLSQLQKELLMIQEEIEAILN